jgi:hypothetical protein
MQHFESMYDSEEIRCGKLGHSLTFKYCRRESVDKPCERIINCWSMRIKILEYLNNQFGTAFLKEFVARKKKDKMSHLLNLIDQSKAGDDQKQEAE